MVRNFGVAAVLAVSVALAGCESPAVKQPAVPESKAPGKSLQVSPEGVEASEPAIAAGADGHVFVAYVQKSGEAADLYVRAYHAGKGTLGEPVRVNPVAGQVRTWYGDPPTIAIGPRGTLHIGWTARYPGGEKGTILYMSASRDGGATFAEPVRVNDDAEPASHGMHSMAVAKDGTIHFAWLDERYLKSKPPAAASPTPHAGHGNASPHPEEAEVEPNAELYYASSTDSETFGPNRRLDGDICPCCKTSTVVSEKGRVAIGFRKVFDGEFRHIAVTALNDFGDAWSPAVQVSDDAWRINACPVSGPALRFDRDSLEVAWFSGADAGQKGVYMSRWTDGGRGFEPRKLIAETTASVSPSFAEAKLLWSAEGRIGIWNAGAASLSAEGRNVVAAAANGHTYFAFVSTETERKSVRLGFE